MDGPVAVVDSIPLYRLGVSDHLGRAGISVEAPEDPVAWAGEPGPRVVVISLRESEDWDVLHELGALEESDRVVPVAVVPSTEVEPYRRALTAGARGVVTRNTDPDALLVAVQHAVDGHLLLPVEIAQGLATQQELVLTTPSIELTEWDVGVLRERASGRTVDSIANRRDMSTRHVRRRLSKLYERMGVHSTEEAIARAAHWGVLDAEES